MLLAQQPQAPASAPLYAVNAKYVNGLAPGYWPMAGSGLTLMITAGTAYCGNPPSAAPYAGGSLAMNPSTTNYVYLDPAAGCSPAVNTTGFAAGYIPIAKVATGASSITSVTDLRTWFSPNPAAMSGAGAVQISALGSNQNVTLTPSGAGLSVIAGLADKAGQVFNVKAYGATGNGTTDDTAAIESMETARAAVKGTGYFPCGTYLISSTLTISVQGGWQGESGASNGSGSCVEILAKSGTSLDPMIKMGHSNTWLKNMRVDANADAIVGVQTQASGSEPRDYNVQLTNVQIQDFPRANSSVIGLDLAGPSNQYACSQCVFYNVEVFSNGDYQQGTKSTGTGISISRENNDFYHVSVAGWGTGVLFGGGPSGDASDNSFFGGFIGDDGSQDISLTTNAKDVQNSFFGTWFEGSAGPVVGGTPSGSYTDQQLHFFNCHLNTYSTASIIDLTNMVGGVTLWGGAFDISNSGLVITASQAAFKAQGTSFTNSLTFSGANHVAYGPPAASGSQAMGTTAVGSDACGDQVTVQSGSPIYTGMKLQLSQNADPNHPGLFLMYWTDNTPALYFKWCNMTASSITPSAQTIHWVGY